MAKIGYVFKSSNSDDLEQDMQWMRDFGCIEEPIKPSPKGGMLSLVYTLWLPKKY